MKSNTRKDYLIAAGLAIAALILAFVSHLILPDPVIASISFTGGASDTVSKPYAICIPVAITFIGDILYLVSGGQAKQRNMIVAVLGVLVVLVIYSFNFSFM